MFGSCLEHTETNKMVTKAYDEKFEVEEHGTDNWHKKTINAKKQKSKYFIIFKFISMHLTDFTNLAARST